MRLTFVDDQSGGLSLMRFLEGGAAYNGSMLAAAIVGIVAAFVALWIAILQLRRIRRAAEAAAEAAKGARRQVLAVGALSDVSHLCALARELLTHLRTGNYEGALLRASDLRGGLARARESLRRRTVGSSQEWQDVVTKLVSVQDALEKHDQDSADDGQVVRRCVRLMNDVHERLNSFVSKVEARAGDH